MSDEHVHQKAVRVEAESLDEALALAAERLGTDVAAIDYEIEQEGAHGFFGIRHRPFIVRATVAVGEIHHRLTRSGAYVKISPPLSLAQAQQELAAQGVTVAHDPLVHALAVPPETWCRVGDGAPDAPAPPVTVAIAEDEMTATVVVGAIPPSGRTLDVDEVVSILEQNGVTFGVDRDAIDGAIDHTRGPAPVVVAHGAPAMHGRDAEVRYSIRTDKAHIHLVEDDHGQIDFHELGLFEHVTEGQLLAERVDAEPRGPDGRTVTGRPVVSRDGVGKVTLKGGKNTALSEDGARLTATAAGQVLYANGIASVELVQEIRGNVDFKTGNIDSRGSVIVRGDVTPGFRVHADGNLDIQGQVESAQVSAKGDVVIRKGVFGKGTAKIDAGGDVFAKFLDRVVVHAGRDVVVEGEILTSDVHAGRNVKSAGSHGSIVGGHVTAGDTVTAATLGSRLGVATFVTAGKAIVASAAACAGVHVAVNEAKAEIQDTVHKVRFVENEGEIFRMTGL